jgi:mannosyltransferase
LSLPATPEQAKPAAVHARRATAAATASGTAGPATATSSGRRVGIWLALLVPAIAELAIGGYQLGGASLWRDEGYTLEVAGRPVGAILSMMGQQDAVHGFYYLLMHFVVAGAGTSAVALRLPSLLAMSVAAGLTGGLGRRLAMGTGLPAPSVTGMLGGLLLVMYPLTTWYAQDARPYGLTTLCAVAASWLLLHSSSDNRWRWYVLYAVAIVLLGLFNVFALLLVPAHGITLWLARGRAGSEGGHRGLREYERRWLAATVGAGIVLSPYLVVAGSQAGSLGWVPRPGVGVVLGLISDFAGSKYLVPVVGVLVGICVAAEFGRKRRTSQPRSLSDQGWNTANLAVPWLALPPILLLAVSLISPAYVERYVVFCMPATALLTANGLVRLGRFAAAALTRGRQAPAAGGQAPAAGGQAPAAGGQAPAAGGQSPAAGRQPATTFAAVVVLVIAILAAVQAGPQHRARLTSDRPDNMRGVAQIVAAYERPGDGVIYLPWDARVVGITYPAPFARLSEIGQKQSPASSDTLRGSPVPVSVLVARLSTVRRVWIVRWLDELNVPRVRHAEALLGPHLRLIRTWTVQSVQLSLYQVRSG